MAVASPDRLRSELADLVHRTGDVDDFSSEAARILARGIPFDGICVLTMDPATTLPTGEFVENGLPSDVMAQMVEIEFCEGDVNGFSTLARSGQVAATLSEATGGDLAGSRRHRELRAPSGFGDELRAILMSDGSTWGALTLLRRAGSDPFDVGDAPTVASLAPYLAEGLRRAMLPRSTPADAEPEAAHPAAGVVVLHPDSTVNTADAAAAVWLDELGGGRPMPQVVAAVAARAREIAAGQALDGAIARARVRTAAGTWLSVYGSAFDGGQTVIVLEPARAHELAPLIAAAYGLTSRERDITQLVAQGCSTDEIADRLHLSAWTVQDHLKAIFEKTDVSTRGQLVARLFFAHYAPRLSEGTAAPKTS
jgi:DNA-binding CsgD family transcriptional regulator